MLKIFSSNSLKILAMFFMLIDHIGLLFFPSVLILRIIGRLAFPIFAFLIAEGYGKTSNLVAYIKRLIIFAAIAQVPYSLFLSASGVPSAQNIFFTLSAGLLAIAIINRSSPAKSILAVVCIALVAEILNFDYGAYGILTIIASRLFITSQIQGLSLLLALPFIYFLGILDPDPSPIQIFAILSIPLLYLYNNKIGKKLPRYLFYGFYPAHLLLLWLIWYLLPS